MIRNFLLTEGLLETISGQICPVYFGLDILDHKSCLKANEHNDVCNICWRKAIIANNRIIEKGLKKAMEAKIEKENKDKKDKEKIIAELGWCVECQCYTTHINEKCVVCDKYGAVL